ncbi:MAG: single-stranded-DNA-specific exonuclease RecJ [Gammaproteobacteria bacterium]|nr:single-stranded-DNA-specific exonuclease RecJ [Gammaproteobacteria bacterium]MCZ6762117.1 single-stranded-DNA-specific exonuclease RecJ [Gammaproteobacteria bacterium]
MEIRNRPLAVEDFLPADMHPVLKRIYLGRGVGETQQLDLSLGGLLPIGDLGGTGQAVDLMLAHRQKNSLVLIVGDFDADGATSTALLIRGLKQLGFGRLGYLLPDRFFLGYGLTPAIVEIAGQRNPGLIVTVDNGISSIDGVALARKMGIDVLVTDHHLPGPLLPDANVILNPNLRGENFSGKSLAGVGVAFYLLAACERRLGASNAVAAGLLDLVALGTVADVVPLERNNRILVEQGLRRIRAGRCCAGITALLEVAGRQPARARANDLGFAVGPRLNAAGRLDDMTIGVECLLADQAPAARILAARLDALNRERRGLEKKMAAEALAIVDGLALEQSAELPWGICLFDPGWHQGLVGLVASRVREKFSRPVVAFAPGQGDELKGSARSVPGLHIRDALDEIATSHPGLLGKFGGHAMAAGLSLERDRFASFAEAFDEVVRDRLGTEDLQAFHFSDGQLAEGDLDLTLAELVADAGPWGQGFPEPQFDGEFELIEQRVVGDSHLRLTLRSADGGRSLGGIAFSQSLPDNAGDRLRLVYRLEVNEFRGRREAQLNVIQMQALE